MGDIEQRSKSNEGAIVRVVQRIAAIPASYWPAAISARADWKVPGPGCVAGKVGGG